jgi:aromatic ring-opening dioxygenase LigB subunit
VIAWGAIAPHGGVSLDGSEPLRVAMRELGRRCEAAALDALVVLTPHGVHVEEHLAVVVAAALEGEVEDEPLTVTTDRLLAETILRELRADGVPALGISFGSNAPELAEHPLDWGAHVPLFYLPRLPVVVISPARELSLVDHVRAGAAISRAPGRIGLVASADHAHTHAEGGPYHVDPEAARAYDEALVALVAQNRLEGLLELGPAAEAALADSLWQLLVLHGALGNGFDADLLVYEAPSYFGMLVASFEPTAPASSAIAPQSTTTSASASGSEVWSARNPIVGGPTRKAV